MTQHDFTIADAVGKPVRLDLQAALQALATNSSGTPAPTTTYPGMLWLDTSVAPNGRLRMRNLANNAWIDIAGFPVKGSSAEAIAGTDDTKYVTPKGLADRAAVTPSVYRNRMTNPAMQISQENGDTLLTAQGYPADQWLCSTFGGAHSFQRVASITPRKSPKRLRWIVTTAKASPLGASDYMGFFPRIEGLAVNDLGWGAAGYKPIIVRFGFRGPAGTYTCCVRNNTSPYQSYIKTFTIAAGQANTDTEQVFAIPGNAAGGVVWETGNTAGLLITICMGAGSAYSGVEGWQSGLMLTTAACSNGMATVGNTFEVFDFGVYLDVAGTGVPPLWEMPDEATELLACQRYYCAGLSAHHHGPVDISVSAFAMAFGPTEMRTSPTFVGVNQAAASMFPSTMTAPTVIGSARVFRESRVATGTGVGFYWSSWNASARL